MLRVLARFLHDRDAPLLGQAPGRLEAPATALMTAANKLPRRTAEKIYAASGWAEAIRPEHAGRVDAQALARWVVDHYPERRYPAVFIGSSNGAMIHLAAALGVPWLPQTLLTPIRRRGGHPDEPAEALRLHRQAGEDLLAANPDLVLHHMHDPNQDRLMGAGMSYFRVKWRRLPAAYREFLESRLAPGGKVITVECGLQWPVTRVGERYYFQHGALGGLSPEEFRYGGPRVAAYLARYGSPLRAWDAPEPDATAPEAEWGFEPDLLTDLSPDVRLRFAEPEDLSRPVAELYRRWYQDRGLPGSRLLAETFLLIEPWWTLRTGSVPYWLVFNTEPSRQSLLKYLATADPYDEIRLALFSHGVESAGLADIDDWREVLRRARKVGAFTGVDPRAFPRDFRSLARTHRDLSHVRHVYPMPEPLGLDAVTDIMPQG
jgi:hypothetical protein